MAGKDTKVTITLPPIQVRYLMQYAEDIGQFAGSSDKVKLSNMVELAVCEWIERNEAIDSGALDGLNEG